MQTVGSIIRARRRELGLTLQAIADAVGCAKSYLSTIENDRRAAPPSRPLIEKIEAALRMRQGSLVSVGAWQNTPQEIRREMLSLQTDRHIARRLAEVIARNGLDNLHRSGELRKLVDRLAPSADDRASGATNGANAAHNGSSSGGGGGSGGGMEFLGALPMQVPVINKIAAGYPCEFTDLAYPARVADDYISVPDVYDTDAFAARVVGDSMTPAYHEGDIVVFSPAADTTPGSDCFVRFERDAETTFKRIYFETGPKGAELIRLQPLNASYAPKLIPREEIAGLYAAVYVVRKVAAAPAPPAPQLALLSK